MNPIAGFAVKGVELLSKQFESKGPTYHLAINNAIERLDRAAVAENDDELLMISQLATLALFIVSASKIEDGSFVMNEEKP